MSKLRQIKPLNVKDILPSMLPEDQPEFKWVDPKELYIEENYQRSLGERSITTIRRIVKDFSWAKYKPPVVSIGAGGKMCVIDGQHTAIAAASHPKLPKIPVMIVVTGTEKERAQAFMGQNKDRVAVTSMQLFYSAMAAGDETAIKAKKALDESGCVLLKFRPLVWVEGQTLAAGSVLKLAERFGEKGLTRILDILMNAKRAPVTAAEMNAVALLLHDKDWHGKFEDEDLSDTIRTKSIEQWQADADAHVRKGMKMPMNKALAITWFKHVPKRKGPAAGKK